MYHLMTPSQLEIKFFWPLTEQIDLDLDYRGCDTRPKISASPFVLGGTGINYALCDATVTTAVLKLTEDTVTFTYKEEPPWYRKLILKIIGFKWEKR